MRESRMMLEPAKHLVKVKLNKEHYIIYHSLLGGPMQVKQDVLNLIQRFKGGVEIKQAFSKKELALYNETICNLKEHHLLVGKGVDEYSLLKPDYKKIEKKRVKGRLIQELRLEMASFCNFRCQHCYAPKIYKWKKGRILSFSMAKLACDGFLSLLKKSGNNFGGITFWGGEPLLNWKVIKQVVEYIEQLTKNSPLRINCGIVTNGSLLNEQIFKFMKKHGIGATVSLDGLEKENDQFRKFTNGRGAFKSIIKGIEGLSRYGIRFWVELCLNDYNFYSVEKVIDFIFDNYKCEAFLVNPIFFQEAICPFDHHSAKEKAKRIMDLYDYGVKKGVRVHSDGLSLISKAMSQRPTRFFCAGLNRSLYVNPLGLVYPCQKIRVDIGRVEEMEVIPQSKNYHYVGSRGVDRIKGCKGCKIEGFCAGGCAGIAEFYSGDIYDISHPLFQSLYCDFRRHLFKELLKYYARQRRFQN